jgi:hypothetical protein
VSAVLIVASVERYQRSVVAAAEAVPLFFTVAEKVKLSLGASEVLLADGLMTVKSGAAGGLVTVICTPAEQLFVMLDSPLTASAQAPSQYVPAAASAVKRPLA